MDDLNKSKEQLIAELRELREKVADLERVHSQLGPLDGSIFSGARLLEIIPDAVISTDPEFIIKTWNAAAEHLYGWSGVEVIGKPLNKLLRPEYPEEPREKFVEELLEKGFYEGESVHRTQDGKPVVIWGRVTMLEDENGKPLGAVMVNRDITAQKRLEEKYGE